MAVVKKRIHPSSDGDAGRKTNDVPVQRKTVKLSTDLFVPSSNLFDYNFLLYGQRKIGKTTLAAEAEKAYFFFFEPNDSYSLYKSDIQEWWEFNQLSKQFTTEEHEFKTAIIDTVRPCYNMALDFACKRHGFEHPGGQNDRGMAWSKVSKEFEPPVRRLMTSNLGFIAIAHEYEAEIKTRSGDSFHKMVPDMPASAARLLANEVYNIFYYYIEGGKRWLQIEGDEYITAGHRMRGHFLTPAGERIFRIPMGDNEKVAFQNLLKAFDNKQEETYNTKGGDKEKINPESHRPIRKKKSFK